MTPPSPTDELHVDLYDTTPFEPAVFRERLPLDHPMLFNAIGNPSQLAEGSATYHCVSEPHAMADCPHEEAR